MTEKRILVTPERINEIKKVLEIYNGKWPAVLFNRPYDKFNPEQVIAELIFYIEAMEKKEIIL